MAKENVAIAKLKYLHMAPRKVRLVANSIKGKHVIEAEAQLAYAPQRAAKPLLKLLRSAANNASNKKLDKNKLFVKSITVDEGPMLKRWLPRAMGRATPIQKKMSHITLVLEEKMEFNRYKVPQAKITKSEKKLTKTKEGVKEKEHEPKKKSPMVEEIKKKPQEGFARKIFRRKEIA